MDNVVGNTVIVTCPSCAKRYMLDQHVLDRSYQEGAPLRFRCNHCNHMWQPDSNDITHLAVDLNSLETGVSGETLTPPPSMPSIEESFSVIETNHSHEEVSLLSPQSEIQAAREGLYSRPPLGEPTSTVKEDNTSTGESIKSVVIPIILILVAIGLYIERDIIYDYLPNFDFLDSFADAKDDSAPRAPSVAIDNGVSGDSSKNPVSVYLPGVDETMVKDSALITTPSHKSLSPNASKSNNYVTTAPKPVEIVKASQPLDVGPKTAVSSEDENTGNFHYFLKLFQDPQTAPGDGLVPQDINWSMKTHDGKTYIFVSGNITNPTNTQKKLPLLEITAYGDCSEPSLSFHDREANKNKTRCTLQVWEHKMSDSKILRSEKLPFNSSILFTGKGTVNWVMVNFK